MSDTKPTDFNDLFRLEGGETVKAQVEHDLDAINRAKQTHTNQRAAQLLEGGKIHKDIDDLPPEPVREPDFDWQAQFDLTKDGDLRATVKNTELILRHDEGWRGVLGYCEFSYKIMKHKKPPMPHCEAGEWKDLDSAALRIWMSHQYRFSPNHSDIADALAVVANSHKFHPVRDWLQSLEWDGEPRLGTWMKHALGSTEAEDYLKIVGTKFLIGAVARVMCPGCKMDNVIILEGNQGRGKSTAVSILFGEWFTDAALPLGDKDAYQVIQGKWGFELGELDAFNKSEVTALKHFFTQQVDRFRPSYGRVAMDHPRQTVFIGTTNQEAYLRDYTGNRRFWPVFCTTIDHVWLRKYRLQLWAEALALFEAGAEWWVTYEETETVEEVQDGRLQRDPWEESLLAYLAGRSDTIVTTAELLREALGFDAAHIQQAHTNRVGPIMRSLGWLNERQYYTGEDGKRKQRRVWMSPKLKDKLDEVPL